MTVVTTNNRVVNLGNGATTAFAYNFLIPAATDVVVIFTDTTGTAATISSSNYSITGIGNATGGTVTYPLTGSPIALGTSLTIERLLPLVQEDVISNQTFYPNVIEQALDYEMMCLQQLEDQLGRSIEAPVSDPLGVNYTIPAVAQRAGQLLSFDNSGNVITGQPTGTIVSAAMQPVVQAPTIAAADTLLGITSIGMAAPPLSPSLGGTGLTTFGPLTGQVKTVTTTYSVVNGDKGKTLYCTAGDYTITIGNPTGYDNDFQVRIYNSVVSGNAPLIAINGITPFRLMPQQSVDVQSAAGTAWFTSPGSPVFYANESGSGLLIYVNAATGNDSNSGLSPSFPFADIQTAIEFAHSIQPINQAGHSIILALNQTYNVGNGIFLNYAMDGGTQLPIFGQTGVTTPNVILNCLPGGSCINTREPATTTASGIQYTTSGNGSVAVNASQFATIDLEGGFAFGAFPLGTHISGANQASINVLSNYEVYSNASAHISITQNTYLNYGSFTVTMPNALVIPFWIIAVTGAVLEAGGVPMTFIGAGSGAGTTGAQYAVANLAMLDTSGTVYPGNTTGSTSTGGQVF